jgi:2'-5' RNA ligase
MNARGGSLGAPDGPWRCFVGLPLPEPWRLALARVTRALSGRLASRVGWTRPENWHLTLKFLGDVEPGRIPDVAAALGRVAFAPFELALGAAGFFPPRGAPRVVWAGLAAGGPEAARLAAGVEAALAPLGFAPEARPFAAHLTLGRVKDAACGEDWSCVAEALGKEIWGPARAERMVLWRSVLGPAGPKYAALREFAAA